MASIKGGDKLEKALAELTLKINNAATLKVGFLSKAKYPDGTPVALVAAVQDYGAPRAGIPPRPFFRNMVKAKSPEWPKAIAGLLKTHDYDATVVLRLTGEAIKGQLQASIRDTNAPPLKPATIKRKGFAKPLVDTGQMLNSVDYNVD